MVNAVEAFDAKHMKPAEEIPAFRPGDTVDVNVKIKEGNNSRIQTFTGVVIARQGSGLRETLPGPQDQLRHRRGAPLPAALPVHRLHQAGAQGPRASREAVLPAQAARQGGSHRRASRQLRQGDSGLSFAKRGDSTVKFSPEPIGSGLNL